MVAVDGTGGAFHGTKAHTGEIVLLGSLGSGLLVATSVEAVSGTTGWQLAAELVSRFSLLLFVIAMTVESVGRLIPLHTVRALGGERAGFIFAFALSAATSLACLGAPYVLRNVALSGPVIAYCGMTAFVLSIMLASGHPASIPILGRPVWRAMRRVAAVYFWVAFTLIGLDHVIGPHRPDNWYGSSLLLLVAAVLIRFSDALVTRFHRLPPPPAKAL